MAKRQLELYEQILLYLYDNRDRDEHMNLFEKFDQVSKQRVYDKAIQLGEAGLITTEENDLGIGWLDWDTGRINFPNAGEPYLKGKIRNEGIKYVQDNILTKTDWWNVFHKFVETACLISTVVLGFMLYQREETHNKTEQELNSIKEEKDRFIRDIQELNNTLKIKEAMVDRLTTKVDSLNKLIKK